jgi:heptosyltransferase-1
MMVDQHVAETNATELGGGSRPLDAERILIVRPSALGDVCRSVPVLASLRAAYPNARIDWLVQDAFAPAIAEHPALNGVVSFPRRAFGQDLRRLKIGKVLAWLGELRKARYDLVIDCQGLARSGLFTWWTGAGRRIGYSNAAELAWLGYMSRLYVNLDVHAVDRMLRLVEHAGVKAVRDMRLYAPAKDRERIAADAELGGSYVVVAPTSRWAGKRWPEERFSEAISRLLELGANGGVGRVVVVGSQGERAQCGSLIELAGRDARVVDRIGKTSVGELMAIVERSAVVLCNDSAVLHMAVGFDRPAVALYGPTDVRRVGPYRRERDVIQDVRAGDVIDHKNDGAGRVLMERIGVSSVVEAVAARLGLS